MHMALNTDEWLQLNTAYCNRLCAWITAKVCEANSRRSELGTGDLRCSGCGGLHDQAEPLEVILGRSLHLALKEILDSPSNSDSEEFEPEIEEEYEDEDLDSEFDDGLDDLLTKGLGPEEYSFPQLTSAPLYLDPLAQFLISELEKEDEEALLERVEIRDRPEPVRRVRVFIGRCVRCSGYMVRAGREWRGSIMDDEVYHCFNCGWYISPKLDYNRKHPGEGWR